MKFRNKSTDALLTPFGHLEPGDEFDAGDRAEGIVLQCGPDGRFEPADDEARAAVAAATGEDVPVEGEPTDNNNEHDGEGLN